MTGRAAPHPRKLYWRYKAGSQRAVRDGDWKYLRIAGNEFLFDVVKDPRERANLKDRHREVFDRLKSDWEAWILCCRNGRDRRLMATLATSWLITTASPTRRLRSPRLVPLRGDQAYVRTAPHKQTSTDATGMFEGTVAGAPDISVPIPCSLKNFP